ncbi:MAG: CpsD/CapB family tyrosine-protein kinase [Sulfuricaulis sp.]|uniref:CpsD/CapB family tyrosine-protein kinase n=1 Tax=Sulfuricaulis sp. TaxID=2003553 RepID=UPI003C565F3E
MLIKKENWETTDPYTRAIERVRQDQGQDMAVEGRRALVPTDIVYTQTRQVDLYPGWLKQHRIISGDSQDEVARAYKVLRTQVSQRMRQHGWRTLGVSSPRQGEGKTLTAINLSISLALERNQSVLLVDANLGQPSIHSYLGIDVEQGLREHLLDGTPVQKILVNPRIPGLVILPGSVPLNSSSETLTSRPMLQLVQELKRRYPMRWVIFDLPPVLVSDEVLAIAPYIDAMLLVVEEGKTMRPELARAAELVQASNKNLIGTVLNNSGERNSVYGMY